MKPLIIALGAMLAVTVVSSARAAESTDQIAHGHQVFDYWCSTCHAPDPREGGRLLPGTQGLSVKYHGERPAALEQRTDLTADFIKYIIRHGIDGMPFFRKTEISDTDREAIAAYLARNTK